MKIIPVRCFSCGKVIGDKWEAYLKLLANEFSEGCVSFVFYASTPFPSPSSRLTRLLTRVPSLCNLGSVADEGDKQD